MPNFSFCVISITLPIQRIGRFAGLRGFVALDLKEADFADGMAHLLEDTIAGRPTAGTAALSHTATGAEC